MKKTFLIGAMAAIALSSCKKNEQAGPLAVEETPTVPAPAVRSQEEMIKNAQNKPLTNVAISENHFDFGKIKKGDKVQHVYEITNTGSNPLVISEVVPGCGCTAPSFTKEPILPGKTGQITLSFDSSSFDGVVGKEASVYANVEKSPIVLTFSANIQPK